MTETKGLPFSYTATQFSSRSKVVCSGSWRSVGDGDTGSLPLLTSNNQDRLSYKLFC